MILAICPNPSVDTFAWVAAFEPGGVNRIEKERRFPGGKGVHVALALAELGEETALLAYWGGPTGAWIKARCEEAGIRCLGPEVEAWSRHCLTLKTAGAHDETELLGAGPLIRAGEQAAFLDEFSAHVGQARAITLSGSLPAGVPADLYGQLIARAREEGVPTFLDCTGESFRRAIAEAPFCVHLNAREGREITGETEAGRMGARLPAGVRRPAITAGADGLYLGVDGRVWHGLVRLKSALCAVGSGDCLLAGLAAAAVRGLGPEETVRLAVACGAANCLREDLGMLFKKDVEALMNRVEVYEEVRHTRDG